jgi:hypothetical protein
MAAREALRRHGFADAEVNFAKAAAGTHRHDGDERCIIAVRCDWKERYLTVARIVEGERLALEHGTTVMQELFGARGVGKR